MCLRKIKLHKVEWLRVWKGFWGIVAILGKGVSREGLLVGEGCSSWTSHEEKVLAMRKWGVCGAFPAGASVLRLSRLGCLKSLPDGRAENGLESHKEPKVGWGVLSCMRRSNPRLPRVTWQGEKGKIKVKRRCFFLRKEEGGRGKKAAVAGLATQFAEPSS